MKKIQLLFLFAIFASIGVFAQNNAQFISQTGIPDTIMAGQQFTFSITMKNTGSTTWTDADNYHLGSQSPQDNTYWGNSRFLLPNDVAPGEEVTITATATAPSNVNPAGFQWRMVQDGVEWFGEQTELVNVVIPDAQYSAAQFISQSIPANIQAGQEFVASITFKNTGTTTWSESNFFRLGSKSPANNFTWGTNRIYLTSDVAPGEEYTFVDTLTAPANSGFYIFQWQMEIEGQGWFGEESTPEEVIILRNMQDSLLSHANSFSVNNHIVSTSFFTWFGQDQGQQSSPWIPLEGRENWTGDVEFWKTIIKQVMMANIDVLYVELIPYMEDKRGNMFIALSELRHDGWNVPKVCPFLDPEITYTMYGYNADCSTEAGKDELISHYIRFYRQYFATNTDQFADDFIYTQDGHPVLNIWHIHLHIDNYDQLTRNDVTSRLSAEFGSEHPIFNNDIKMINNAYSPCFSFADERIYQFEMQEYKIDKDWNGINSSLLKPGYWDQNVRNPGTLLARDGGSHYIDAWNQVNNDATIDRVYIESFNEYDEGSGIYAARTDTIYKKTDGGMNNTGNDVWSSNNDPFEYLKTTASGAAQFNDIPELDATILWDNIPQIMYPGESFTATVIVRNDGDTYWTGANNFKFGEMETIDTVMFGAARYPINDTLYEIPYYGGVFRGRAIALNIEITAPDTVGTFTTHWGMLQEFVAWFGDTLVKQITVDSPQNVADNNIDKLKLYPNPAKDKIYISGLKNAEKISIIDINGKLVYNENFANRSVSKYSIDISKLKQGTYFVKIVSGSTVLNRSFVKP